jgi:murein DD-endopeptidase MepM/ murein hydrolase activator NlpD
MEEASPKQQRKERRKRIIRKLKVKYRLVIMDDSTFAERFSLRLSPMNLFIWLGSLALALVIGTTLLIAYTPLKEYIPGYPDGSERRSMIEARIKADTLEARIKQYDDYVRNIQMILNGETQKDTLADGGDPVSKENVKFSRSQEDSLLRIRVEEQEKYELGASPATISSGGDQLYGVFFFTPLQGTITQSFSIKERHFGVDIASSSRDAIKSTLDGTVIFSDWTSGVDTKFMFNTGIIWFRYTSTMRYC